MQKVDFKKEYKQLYRQSDKKVSHVVVPEFNYLAIDGKGHPEKNKEFEQKIGSIYGVAYTLKFLFKKPEMQPEGYFEFVLPPLEALWYMKDDENFDQGRPDDWRWTLMIMQADYVIEKHVELAKAELKVKGKANEFIDGVRLENMKDGKAVQLLHIGPYNEVGPTVEMLMKELDDDGLQTHGRYREIYLNDPRRVSLDKIKTICRMPYK